jgi:alcohol dehydrogenase class IV
MQLPIQLPNLTVVPKEIRTPLSYASHRAQIVALGTIMTKVPQRTPFSFTGAGSSLTLAKNISDAGFKKILLVSDPGLVKLGLISPIQETLANYGVDVALFDGIQPDPALNIVKDGVEMATKHGAEAILAVGGGSSLDAAKIMAAAIGNDCKPEKLKGYFKLRKPMIPLYVIPTTAGTGSEVTMAAVISNPEKGVKDPYADPRLIPNFMALDPSLQLGLPASITAAVGMDALTHAVESYVSIISGEETRRLSVAATKLVFDNLHTCCTDGKNIQARENMIYASTYGGQAFTRASVGYVHAYAHQFGGLYHVPHGLANAIALPYVFEYYLGSKKACKSMKKLAVLVGKADSSDTPLEGAEKLVQAIVDLKAACNIPVKLDKILASDVGEIVERVLRETQGTYPVPRYMNAEECEEVLRKMMV